MTESEECVANRLDCLNPNKYLVLNDLLIPSAGKLPTAQIDHVVVSKHGIFSIETKSKAGWVYGDSMNKKWKHYFYRQREEFFNPLFQNHLHVKSLQALLHKKYPWVQVKTIVVFSHAKAINVTGTRKVVGLCDLIPTIRSFKEQVLTEGQMYEIEKMLRQLNLASSDSNAIHNRQVEQYVAGIESAC